jgi:Tfp pilus assembly protein PilV
MKNDRHRFGFVSVEILVAATLLVALVSSLAAIQYRLLAIAKDTKHYQLALHEAANQIVALQAISVQELDRAIERATLDEDFLRSLPGAKMQIEKFADTSGVRVVVQVVWDRLGAPVPVELTGWISTVSVEQRELKGQGGS